jgi:hypothetical protein
MSSTIGFGEGWCHRHQPTQASSGEVGRPAPSAGAAPSAGVAAIHGGGRKGVCWHRTGVGPAVGSILSVAVKLLSCGY